MVVFIKIHPKQHLTHVEEYTCALMYTELPFIILAIGNLSFLNKRVAKIWYSNIMVLYAIDGKNKVGLCMQIKNDVYQTLYELTGQVIIGMV